MENKIKLNSKTMQVYLPVKWAFTLESKFTSAYLKEFQWEKCKDWWAFKIPDLIRTIKPFDWFWVNKWWAYFCEVKMMEWNVFKFSDLRNNQYTALKRISILTDKFWLENIHAIVMIYSKRFKKYKIIKFSEIIEAEENWKDQIKFLF